MAVRQESDPRSADQQVVGICWSSRILLRNFG